MASEYQIDELGVAVAREHDVSGLQVPVHDPVLVSVAKRLRDSGSKLERLARRERFARHAFGEASPAEKLHRDKEDAVGFVDLMDDADVRMLEGSGGGGFLHESLTALGLLDEIRRQDFQRYLAVELLVAGAVDDLQLAPTELFEHRAVRKGFPIIVSTQFPLIGTTVRARGCSVASGRGGPGEA